MRIAINAHYLYRARLSGLARYAHQVRDVLAAEGHTLTEVKSPAFLYANDGRALRLLRFLALLFVEIVVPPFLIVMRRAALHVSPAFTAPLGLFSRRYIVVVHDLAFIEFPRCYSRLERWYYLLNLAILKAGRHRIVVPSGYVRERLRRYTGMDAKRVTVISPYSELSKTSVGMPAKEKYFVLLSNAHLRKNIEQTLQGFLASKAPVKGYKLFVVGNFEVPVGRQAAAIVVRSGMSDADLATLIGGASAMLLFSLSEGFGYPVVEAARLGVVSLTSEATSLRELIAPPREPQMAVSADDIAARIDLYLSDERFRAALERDKAYLNAKYSRHAFTTDWKELIGGR